MPLQDTGVAISLSDIQEEFGGDNPISLSEYYKDGDYVGSSQSTIPSSGAISFSNFYGTQKAAAGAPAPVSSDLTSIGYSGGLGNTGYEIIRGLYAENTSRTEGQYILSDGTTSDFRNQATYNGSNKVYTPDAVIQAKAGDTIKFLARATAKGYNEYVEYYVYLGSWTRVHNVYKSNMNGNYDAPAYNYTIPASTTPGSYAIAVALSYSSLGATSYRSWKSYSLHVW